MGHNLRLDYATYAKRGFFLGLALLVIGAIGESILPSVTGSLPGWEDALFFYCMTGGIIVGFFAVFGFGIFLPLTD